MISIKMLVMSKKYYAGGEVTTNLIKPSDKDIPGLLAFNLDITLKDKEVADKAFKLGQLCEITLGD